MKQVGVAAPDGEGRANRGYGCVTALLAMVSFSCLLGWIVT